MKKSSENLLIIGVGLMGGSLGQAVKKNKLVKQVYGVSRHVKTLRKAKQIKAIDAGSTQLPKYASKADLVVIATPLNQIIPTAKKIAPILKEGAVVTDIGSVKAPIVKSCQKILGKRFIGSHPMAGSEQSGVAHADANILKGAVCILTPTSKTPRSIQKRISTLWRGVGCQVKVLSPQKHDAVTAYISHLPHLISVALVQNLAQSSLGENFLLKFVGSGFRDMSRIAEADPKLWQEILKSNAKEVRQSLKKHIRLLEQWDCLLETDHSDKILSSLKKARSIRRKLS